MAPTDDAAQVTLNLIRMRFGILFPTLPPEQIEQLALYKTEIVRLNSAANLVPANGLSQLDTNYFADAFKTAELIFSQSLPSAPLYDLGSGNGFPGMVLAIMRPSLEVVLVERDSRKADFLTQFATQANIKNVRVLAASIESLPEKSVQLAVARGLGTLSKGMLATRKMTDIGGVLFYVKTDSWPQELAAIPPQLLTHWDVSLVGTYRIPETETDMAIISAKKTSD